MGRGSSKAGGGGGGSKAATKGTQTNSGTTQQLRSVNTQKVVSEVRKIDPAKFVTYEQPEIITVSGVAFQRFNTSDYTTSKGEQRYISSYQATIPASNGTYPVFEVVVESKTRRRKGKKTVLYDYVEGWNGTGIKK